MKKNCPKTRQCPKKQFSWDHDKRPLCKLCNKGKDVGIKDTTKDTKKKDYPPVISPLETLVIPASKECRRIYSKVRREAQQCAAAYNKKK